MLRKAAASALALSLAAVLVGNPNAVLAADFYQSKTVRIIVGWAAGGGFDIYARMVAKHLADHIPGQPTIIVENMPGAGSVGAANYLYKVAAPDGLTVASFTSDSGLMQALDIPTVKGDVRKFNWLGAAFKGTFTCAVMGFTGFKTWDDIKSSSKTIQMGATRPASNMNVVPTLLNRGFGSKFKVVVGYRGTSEFRVALQRRELDGACWNWASMKTVSASMLHAQGDEKLIPFAFSRVTHDPEAKGVPLIQDLISDPDARKAFETYIMVEEMPGPYALPPGTPQDRVDTLRAAFKAVFDDPRFMAEAKRVKMEFEYVSPAEIDENMGKLLLISDKTKVVLKSAMGIK